MKTSIFVASLIRVIGVVVFTISVFGLLSALSQGHIINAVEASFFIVWMWSVVRGMSRKIRVLKHKAAVGTQSNILIG